MIDYKIEQFADDAFNHFSTTFWNSKFYAYTPKMDELEVKYLHKDGRWYDHAGIYAMFDTREEILMLLGEPVSDESVTGQQMLDAMKTVRRWLKQ